MRARGVLSAVPVAARGARLTPMPEGGGVLSLREPAPNSIIGRWAHALGLSRAVRVELDAIGVCYWEQVDGARSLAEIQRALCERFALPTTEARGAVVEFTAALMRRNLVALRVEQP